MSLWRFKTADECLTKYGQNWRMHIPCMWGDDMDKYHGQLIPHKYVTKINMDGNCNIDEYGIIVSSQMITKIKSIRIKNMNELLECDNASGKWSNFFDYLHNTRLDIGTGNEFDVKLKTNDGLHSLKITPEMVVFDDGDYIPANVYAELYDTPEYTYEDEIAPYAFNEDKEIIRHHYRIKTREELEDCFGSLWSFDVNWTSKLNSIYGKYITKNAFNLCESGAQLSVLVDKVEYKLNYKMLYHEQISGPDKMESNKQIIEQHKITEEEVNMSIEKESKVTRVADKANNIILSTFRKSVDINKDAIKLAAELKIGDIVSDIGAKFLLDTMGMPKWASFISKRFMRPIAKIIMGNVGIAILTGIKELELFGTSDAVEDATNKTQFVVDAALKSGYISMSQNINADTCKHALDKLLESIPESLLKDAGYQKKV